MTEIQHARFTGSTPQFYDRHLGPVIFDPYARDLARRVPIPDGVRVLEIACGTGIVTRRLLERLPASGTLLATDLNEPMTDHARRSLPADARLQWRTADAQALPFPDAAFDAVVMQFGIMFVPDKLRALTEAHRVLKAGGRLLLNAWDSLARNPFARLAHDVVTSLFPHDPPTFYRTPFGDADPAEHRRRAEAAGFHDVTVEAMSFLGTSESAAHFAVGLLRGNALAVAIEERGTVPLAEVEQRLAEALRRELGDRPVRTPLRAWVVSGTA